MGAFDVGLHGPDVAVPFVVAHRSDIKTGLVHQRNHRIIGRFVLVIDGIARAVVASRKKE